MSSFVEGGLPENTTLVGISNLYEPLKDGSGNRPALDHARDILEAAFAINRVKNILVIPNAAGNMDVAVERVATSLKDMGAGNVVSLHNYQDQAGAIRGEGAFYLAGGDTGKLSKFFNDNRPLREAILEQLGKGAVLVGTSAGMMVMGRYTPVHFDQQETPITDFLNDPRTQGLGLIPEKYALAPHYRDNNQPLTAQERKIVGDNFLPLINGVRSDVDVTMKDAYKAFLGSVPSGMERNPISEILALRYGMSFVIQGKRLSFAGESAVAWFVHNHPEVGNTMILDHKPDTRDYII